MAKYWAIGTITTANAKKLPGSEVDDATDPNVASYLADGDLLWAQGTAVVDAAAARATSQHINKGIDENAMAQIMRDAVDSVQATNDAAAPTSANLAATTAGKGAALVGIQDAAALIAATTVEGALAELAAALVAGGITKLQLVTGALVSGLCTVTVGAGQVVTAATRALPIPMAAITGSTNFGSLSQVFASNVAGASGVGQIFIKALGNDGATDVDAAGTFAALLIN